MAIRVVTRPPIETFSPEPKPIHVEKPKRDKPGRPPSGKVLVTMRLDPEVIAKFKATGPGWQARINEALKRAQP